MDYRCYFPLFSGCNASLFRPIFTVTLSSCRERDGDLSFFTFFPALLIFQFVDWINRTLANTVSLKDRYLIERWTHDLDQELVIYYNNWVCVIFDLDLFWTRLKILNQIFSLYYEQIRINRMGFRLLLFASPFEYNWTEDWWTNFINQCLIQSACN